MDKFYSPLTNIDKKYINLLYFLNKTQGEYGGNQGGPGYFALHGDESLINMVKSFYPDYSDEEILQYLFDMGSVGCGYTAIANSIICAFLKDEEKFETAFGYPLMSDGKYNENLVLTEFYSYFEENIGHGTTIATSTKNLILFLKTKGINSSVKIFDAISKDENENIKFIESNITPQTNFEGNIYEVVEREGTYYGGSYQTKIKSVIEQSLAEGKFVNVAVNPIIIYNENSSLSGPGAHAMSITGIDGDIITLSSWGDEWKINMNDYFDEGGLKSNFSFCDSWDGGKPVEQNEGYFTLQIINIDAGGN
jgi:hypothetical protein